MGFFNLFKSSGVYTDLLQAKQALEKKKGIKFIDLESFQRYNFALDCIDMMANKKILSSIKGEIATSLKDTRFGETDEGLEIIHYLNEIDNPKVNGNAIRLVMELIKVGSMEYDNCKEWLHNPSLYERSITDVDYTIKALTLASNKKLQSSQFFDKNNLLSVDDLMKPDGTIYNVTRIQDILDDKQRQ